MRKTVIAAALFFAFPAWAGCPLISVTPCKTAVHHVKKVKPSARKVLNARMAGLERRLTLAEAVLAAQQHQILVMRQQCSQGR